MDIFYTSILLSPEASSVSHGRETPQIAIVIFTGLFLGKFSENHEIRLDFILLNDIYNLLA